MRFLIIGLGSMGKRRIRNLQYLNKTDIIGFDFKEERRREAEEKYGIKTFADIKEALAQNPEVIIISTPPNYHIEYELLAAESNKHFFCEAGIFTDKLKELIKICKDKNIVAAPSCTMRFQDSVKKIKEIIDSKALGKIVAVTYHMGQYLPDWHPWEDISKFYVGQKETSATREMVPFELEWLTWIFGEIVELSCIRGKVSNLKADIDDVYQLIMKFNNGSIGNMLIDVVSRTPTRLLRVVCEEGTLIWDWAEDIVKVYNAKDKSWTEFRENKGFKEEGYVTKENMYIEEMQHFLDSINYGTKYMYSLEDDFRVLNLLKLAEMASNEKEHMLIGGGNE